MTIGSRESTPESKGYGNQVTGNVGMYYVCYILSKMGWNVMSTARNAKGIDIIIYNSDATVTKTIQVKALSKRKAVPLGPNLENIFGDYLIISINVYSDNPSCYILEPSQIRSLAKMDEKDGKRSYWLSPKIYDQTRFQDWSIIGIAGQEIVER